MTLPPGQPEPPERLNESQGAVWCEALARLHGRPDAPRVDPALLEQYAIQVVRLRDAESHVSKHGPIVPAPRTGQPMENPYLKVANQAAAAVDKLSRRLGLEADVRDAAPTSSKPAGPMSVSAYARRRGCTPRAVTKAIGSGRLRLSVVEVRGKPKISDADLADREWAENTPSSLDAVKVVEAAGVPTLAESRARLEHAKAQLAELELEERRGELVAAADVRAKFVEMATAAKTKLLGVSVRARQRIPELTPADVETIDELVREALEELAEGR